jgi:hypothetical protein
MSLFDQVSAMLGELVEFTARSTTIWAHSCIGTMLKLSEFSLYLAFGLSMPL